MRTATVHGAQRVEQVVAYLPLNYWATQTIVRDDRLVVFIEGEDDHGRKLEDYVKPRLQSGGFAVCTDRARLLCSDWDSAVDEPVYLADGTPYGVLVAVDHVLVANSPGIQPWSRRS